MQEMCTKALAIAILTVAVLALSLSETAAAASPKQCSFQSGSKFPSITDLRARHTTCLTARRVARKVQNNGSALQPIIFVRGKRWQAKYISRTEGDAVWYRAVLRSGNRVVTMNLNS